MNQIEEAIAKLCASEREFSRSIDALCDALSGSDIARNHPNRKGWSDKIQSFHRHAQFCADISRIQQDMHKDGIIDLDKMP